MGFDFMGNYLNHVPKIYTTCYANAVHLLFEFLHFNHFILLKIITIFFAVFFYKAIFQLNLSVHDGNINGKVIGG